MPQMSPLMWQAMFLMSLMLLVVSINKNYFNDMKAVNKSNANINFNKLENLWSW